jgi:hypothetical protein
MGFYNCSVHGVRVPNYSECPECMHEMIMEESARNQERIAYERAERERERTAEEGVCDCCGQRFVERTRVHPSANKRWTGVLGRYEGVGVCPRCANQFGGF